MPFLRLFIILAAFAPEMASAAETVTYSYDAKGRLTQATRSGGVNSGAVATYGYDAADNRTQQTVTGANPNAYANPTPVVVVPLNGFQVIIIKPDI